MSIDDRLATVSQVSCFKNGQQQGTASGFFYMDSDRLFFITNRHVVIKEDEEEITICPKCKTKHWDAPRKNRRGTRKAITQ